VKIDFQDIFQFPTLAELAQLIRGSEAAGHREIQNQPEREYYELSYSQRRLWLLVQFEPDSPAFNLGGRITLHEEVDEAIIREALNILVQRHESFRTYFKKIAGEPVQLVQPKCRVKLEVVDLTPYPQGESHISVSFDLEKAPLLRVKLVETGSRRFELLFTMHHIISDGWSLEVLEREFLLLYQSLKSSNQNKLQPLPLRYRDYAVWHNRLLADEKAVEAAAAFWKSQLSGEIGPVQLPYDYPKTSSIEGKSAGYRLVVPGEITMQLRTIARQGKASLFMVLLTAFNLLLSEISGQEDILLGTPAAARQHEGLKNVIGLFVNTLALRNQIHRDGSFKGLLEQVRQNMMQALEYQGFPLELICEELKIKYPDISTFFNMSTFGDVEKQQLTDGGAYHIEDVQDAKFDMVLYLTEYKNGVEINTHYLKALFEPLTIEKIMQKYVKILEGISVTDKPKKKRKISRGTAAASGGSPRAKGRLPLEPR